jgi:hypothetical protein
MGCQSSTLLVASRIDDSIHAMLEHDRKMAEKRGQPLATGYVPRQSHPMLKPVYCSEDDTTVEDSLNMACDECQMDVEAEQVLYQYHTKNHTNTVDRRDLEALQSNNSFINDQQ